MSKPAREGLITAIIAIVTFVPWVDTLGADLTKARSLLAAGRYTQVINQLSAEVKENPAHEEARILLAHAYEQAGKDDDAQKAWTLLLRLSKDDTTRHTSRRALVTLSRNSRFTCSQRPCLSFRLMINQSMRRRMTGWLLYCL